MFQGAGGDHPFARLLLPAEFFLAQHFGDLRNGEAGSRSKFPGGQKGFVWSHGVGPFWINEGWGGRPLKGRRSLAEMPPGRSAEASALLGGHHTKIDRIRKWLSGWRNAPGVPFGLKARIDSGQSMVMVDSVPAKAGCKTQQVSSQARFRPADPDGRIIKATDGQYRRRRCGPIGGPWQGPTNYRIIKPFDGYPRPQRGLPGLGARG